MFVEGRMVEWVMHGYHLELRRRISARLGEKALRVHDVVTNCGGAPQEHQLLYHCNLGFPLLDAGARYLFPTQRVTARTPWALEALADWDKFAAPQAGLDERVYYHELAADAQGQTCLALVNRATDPAQPLGLAMRYSRAALPWLMQWKNPVPGNYVTGLEPGTNQLDGRVAEREAGRMIVLQPGESRTYDLEMQVLTSEAEIATVEAEISALTGGKAPELAKEAAVGE
jgi:hypothetical protein